MSSATCARSSAPRILPAAASYRFCDLTWFPRLIGEGERQRVTLYQVRGLEGHANALTKACALARSVTHVPSNQNFL